MERPDAYSLTDEQQAVLQSDAHAVTVHAGAGTGKTRLLVEWYLHKVLELNASPSEIVAITFTRKAAAEMRERIVRRLRHAGRHEDARVAQVGPISTVHSLCERLLREHPLEAGVDPKFQIVGEGEERLTQAVYQAISHPELNDDELNAVRTFVAKRLRQSESETPAGWLAEQLGNFLRDWRQAGYSFDELQSMTESLDAFHRAQNQCVQEILEAELGQPLEAQWWEDLAAVKHAFKTKKKRLALKRPLETEDESSLRALFGLLRIAVRAWAILQDMFESEAVLDYTGLEERTLAFLQSRADVLEGKYRFLIVDEAQDLNRMQYQILSRIPVERSLFVGDPQQSIYLFRGADARLFKEQMQRSTVYQLCWNHRSTGRILRSVEVCFGHWGESTPALRCARVPVVADASEDEDVFASTRLPDHGAPVEIWMVTEREQIRQIADGIEELVRGEGVNPADITLITAWRSSIDQHAAELATRGIRVTTLGTGTSYFLRSEIRDLASALRALVDPSDDFALLSILRSPLVGMTFDGWTTVGMNAADEGGVLPCLQKRIEHLSDVDRTAVERFLNWFNRLQPLAHQLPTVEILSWIARYTSLDARFALRKDAHRLIGNFRKLLKLSIEHGDLTPDQFADWVRKKTIFGAKESDAETIGEDSNAQPAVKICNVHQAKGLEWNVVVLDARLFERPGDEEILLDVDYPLTGLALASNNNVYATIIKDRKKNRADEEYERLLYVALTRAKERLCIAYTPGVRRNFWSKLLNKLNAVEEPWVVKRWFGQDWSQVEPTTKGIAE